MTQTSSDSDVDPVQERDDDAWEGGINRIMMHMGFGGSGRDRIDGQEKIPVKGIIFPLPSSLWMTKRGVGTSPCIHLGFMTCLRCYAFPSGQHF